MSLGTNLINEEMQIIFEKVNKKQIVLATMPGYKK